MKRTRGCLKHFMLFMLIISMFFPSISGQAATQKQRALKAYEKMLSKQKINVIKYGTEYFSLFTTQEYVKYTGSKVSDVKFGLCYIDNDNVPELIVEARIDNLPSCGIFTFKNGKVRRVYCAQGSSFLGAYKKTGSFKYKVQDDGFGIKGYRKMKGTKTSLELLEHKVSESRSVYFQKPAHETSFKNAISKSRFKSVLKKLNKGRSFTKQKYYKITKNNLKKVLNR